MIGLNLGVDMAFPKVIRRTSFLTEIVENGDFDLLGSDWTTGGGGGITFVGGEAVKAAPSLTESLLEQDIPIVLGRLHRISVTLTNYVTGTIIPELRGGSNLSGSVFSGNGRHRRLLTPVTQTRLTLRLSTSFVGRISLISVRVR